MRVGVRISERNRHCRVNRRAVQAQSSDTVAPLRYGPDAPQREPPPKSNSKASRCIEMQSVAPPPFRRYCSTQYAILILAAEEHHGV